MAGLQLISADSHVNEPPNLWVERIDKAFRNRAPRIEVREGDGKNQAYFILEGMPPIHLAQGLGAGRKPEELPAFFGNFTYEDARAGGWDPAERVKDMDIDGVEADVIYTTLGFRQFWLKDAAFQRACFRVYNDWLAEYCSYAPKRLFGLALISLYDIAEAAKELRRCAAQGLKGAMIWCSPPEDQPYSSPTYDSFWAEAQELNMPLSLHAVTGVGPHSQATRVGQPTGPLDRYVRSAAAGEEVKQSLAVLIFSGVLERFPRLQIVSAENEAGWVPFFLSRVDNTYGRDRYLHPVPLKMKPSEYFQRQVYATFINDPLGVVNRQFVGVDNLMWSSDYPHTVSTWPNSQEVVARFFQGVPEDEKSKIVRENAIKLYGLDLDE
jgi:predicted TIM-barrel fold metal-dependent hydrolase